MFCGKCGAKNEAGTVFCGACGARLIPEQEAGAAPSAGVVTQSVQDAGKHKKVGMIAAAVVAVVAIFAVFSLFGGRSDKATAEKFMDAILDSDMEAVVDLLPPQLITYITEKAGYSKTEYARELADEFSYVGYAVKLLGEGVKVTYKVQGSEAVSGDDLDYLKEGYQEINVKVSAARTVTVQINVRSTALNLDESTSYEIPVIKVGRSWYIDVAS